jgi:hypothetical protein
MDDMTDAPLEGWNDEEPRWAVREEPHWVRM